jgi:hypothetical protein
VSYVTSVTPSEAANASPWTSSGFTVNQGGIPQWVFIAAAVFAAIYLLRRKR